MRLLTFELIAYGPFTGTTLDLANGKYTTLYRPNGKNFVGNINLHWNAK